MRPARRTVLAAPPPRLFPALALLVSTTLLAVLSVLMTMCTNALVSLPTGAGGEPDTDTSKES